MERHNLKAARMGIAVTTGTLGIVLLGVALLGVALLGAALLGAALLGVAGCTAETGAPSDGFSKGYGTLVVRSPISDADGASLPLYLADFAQEQLSVEMLYGEGNPLDDVESGRADIAVLGGPEMLVSRAANQRTSVTAFGLLYSNANFVGFGVTEQSPVRSIQDLNGKTMGMNLGHISRDVLNVWASLENVTFGNIVSTGFSHTSLLDGSCDGVWMFRTTGAVVLPAQGYPVRHYSTESSPFGFPTDAYLLVHGPHVMPEEVARFSRAMDATLATLSEAYTRAAAEGQLTALAQRHAHVVLTEAHRLGNIDLIPGTTHLSESVYAEQIALYLPKLRSRLAFSLEALQAPADRMLATSHIGSLPDLRGLVAPNALELADLEPNHSILANVGTAKP